MIADGDAFAVALVRDPSIWVCYHYKNRSLWMVSGFALWVAYSDGRVELRDSGCDGCALDPRESENFAGILERVPGETFNQAEKRAGETFAEDYTE